VRNVLFLAWRYLAYHRVKSTVLLVSVTLIFFIPAGLRVLVEKSRAELTARAAATPLLVGRKGSPTELVLNSLYFAADVPEALEYGEVERVRATGHALAIPLYARFHAQGTPIVGTSLDYFDFRGLGVAEGRMIGRLGECVAGARTGYRPGDTVTSSPETVFDIAGVYPLRMTVTGVLAPSGGPDDDALFVDVKTTWIIEGRLHGHGALKPSEVLKRDGETLVANRSVKEAQEVTPDNLESFHFHGDPAGFPVTAVLAVPHDAKASALLRGGYVAPDERNQVVRPSDVLDELLGTILTIESFVVAALALVGVDTLMTAALVFWLSLRLRKREIETMRRIGGARGRIMAVLAAEVLGVVLAGVVLAAGLTWLVGVFGVDAVRTLITT
jgi:putative ABC transport system permease protein